MRNFHINKGALMCSILLVFAGSPLLSQFPEDEISTTGVKNGLAISTPGSSSLTGSGNGNVELYTGRASFSLPIFSLKSYDLEVPISLSYLSGGVKIEDFASWVGTDWNLQAGGQIFREVKGLPDDLADRGYFNNYTYTSDFYNDIYDADQKRAFMDEEDFDSEPDIFHYSLGKYSGSFVFDGDKKIHFLPYQNIKSVVHYITLGSSTIISGFELTTPEGLTYIFGCTGDIGNFELNCSVETTFMSTQSFTYQLNDNNELEIKDVEQKDFTDDYFISAWYLTEIRSPSSDFIGFIYSEVHELKYVSAPVVTRIYWQGNSVNYNYFNEEINFFYRYVLGQWVYDPNVTPHYIDPNSQRRVEVDEDYNFVALSYNVYNKTFPDKYREHYSSSQTKITKTVKYLTEISCKSGNYIKFYSTNDRLDLPGGAKLNKITAFNNNDAEIKSVNFNYEDVRSYFLNQEANDPLSFADVIVFKDVNFTWNNPYKIPANVAREYISSITDTKGLDLANYMQEGLKDYNYYRLFLTEVSESIASASMPSYIFNYYGNTSLQRRTSNLVDYYGYVSWSNNQDKQFKNLRIASGYQTYDGSRRQISSGNPYGLLNTVKLPIGGELNYLYELNEKGAGFRVKQLVKKDEEDELKTYFFYSASDFADIRYDRKYYFYHEYDGVCKLENPVYCLAPTTDYYWLCGGIIPVCEPEEKIKWCDKYQMNFSSSQNMQNQNYLYNGSPIVYNNVIVANNVSFDSEGLPIYNSGKEVYKYLTDESMGLCTTKTMYCPEIDIFNWNSSTAGRFNDGFLHQEKHYWQTLKWDVFNTSCNTDYEYGSSTPNFYYNDSYKRGLLKEKFIYSNGDNLLKQSTYDYEIAVPTTEANTEIFGVSGFKYNGIVQWTPYYINPIIGMEWKKTPKEVYIARAYSLKSEFVRLNNVTEKTFDIDGNAIETTKTYDYNDFLQVSKETDQINSGLSKITQYKYITDYPIPGATHTDPAKLNFSYPLNTNHIINVPIEKVVSTIKDGNEKVLGGELIQYNSLGKPDKIYTLDLASGITDYTYSSVNASTGEFYYDNRYKKRQYFGYDDNNNLITSGTCYDERDACQSVGYQWGYNNNYVVSSITNGSSNEVASVNFEENTGWVDKTGFSYTTEKSKTGEKCGKFVGQNITNDITYSGRIYFRGGIEAPTRYKFSAWVYSTTPDANVALIYVTDKPDNSGVYSSPWVHCPTTNKWTLVEGEFEVPTGNDGYNVIQIQVGINNTVGTGTIYFDDVRLYPSNSQMTTYTYKPLIGVSSISDIINYPSLYNYDNFGRLLNIVDFNGNVQEQYKYHYKGQ